MSARFRFFRFALLAFFVLLTVGFINYSTTLVVDQSATGFPINWTQNISQIQVGQEFKPTLEGLNFVELHMQDAECGTIPPPNGNSPMRVRLRIHWKSINGPVVGWSNIASLPPCFDDVARFEFPFIVRLIPGRTYVFELVYVGGRMALATSSTTDAYSGGTIISNGVGYGYSDMWFREGLLLPLATNQQQCRFFGWLGVMRADGHLFYSQAQCTRYVNGLT